MTDFEALFEALADGDVEYVLVGGLAATVHGSARLTRDVDIVYRRSDDNLLRIERALGPFHPYPRGAPPGLPFDWSAETLRRGLNFTLTTTIGAIDLLGEIAGAGEFGGLVARSDSIELFGHPVMCIGLEALIDAKRAAGRPKDYEVLAELEAIREEQDGPA